MAWRYHFHSYVSFLPLLLLLQSTASLPDNLDSPSSPERQQPKTHHLQHPEQCLVLEKPPEMLVEDKRLVTDVSQEHP